MVEAYSENQLVNWKKSEMLFSLENCRMNRVSGFGKIKDWFPSPCGSYIQGGLGGGLPTVASLFFDRSAYHLLTSGTYRNHFHYDSNQVNPKVEQLRVRLTVIIFPLNLPVARVIASLITQSGLLIVASLIHNTGRLIRTDPVHALVTPPG